MSEQPNVVLSEADNWDNLTVSTVLSGELSDSMPQIAFPLPNSHPGRSKDMEEDHTTKDHLAGFVNPAYDGEDVDSTGTQTETPVTAADSAANSHMPEKDSMNEDYARSVKPPAVPPPAQYDSPRASESRSAGKEEGKDSLSIFSHTGEDHHHAQADKHDTRYPSKHAVIAMDDPHDASPHSTQKISVVDEENNHHLDVYRPIVPMPGKIPAVPPPVPPGRTRNKLNRHVSKTHMHTVSQNGQTDAATKDMIIPMEGDVVYMEVSETGREKECVAFDEMTTYKPLPLLPPEAEMPDYSHTHPEKEDVIQLEMDNQPAWGDLTMKDIRENTDMCCSCFLYCFKGKLSKVTPEQLATAQKTITAHCDITESPEFCPPEADTRSLLSVASFGGYHVIRFTGDVCDEEWGRKLFFDDGDRRVDFILAWTEEEDQEKEEDKALARSIFERNLEEEGLDLEYDTKDENEVKYVKVHAPWEVLCRYAEIMKIRMPMKEAPTAIQSHTFLEMMSDYMAKFLSPFELDPAKVPPIPKKFTCQFERDKQYLFAIPEKKELFFSHASRSRIVDYILRRKRYSDDKEDNFAFGINRLLSNDVYGAAYPLHEGSWKPYTKPSMRRLLYEHWANWASFYRFQPLDYVRVYFGEKIGLYFAWLGHYTYFLLSPSIIGLIVFIYGCATMNTNVVAQESCDWNNNFTMCPKCDRRCGYWNYAQTCSHVEASYIFDNWATMLFAVFMSFWGTFYLEFWKREQAGIQFQWNLMGFEEEEEPPRPEYLVRLSNSKHTRTDRVTGIEEPYMSFWKRQVPVYATSIALMLFLVLVALAVVAGIILYRMAVLSALYMQDEALLYENASMVTSATAAIINLIAIFILNFIYGHIAVKLTDWECPRTQSDYESSLTFKLYVLQFVNYYSSLFYIAFFKGRFTGRPGDYNTFMGARQEECSGGGCLMELCIQLSIIFVGKQLIQNNLIEILLPRLRRSIKKCQVDNSDIDKSKMMPWDKDYLLQDEGPRALFHEYLEMLLQFGFVTIFVAAFPLAPLCAWLNNIIEIRADANKFVTQYKRPVAKRAETIGVWYQLLFAVSRLSVLTNAFIIAVTSGFIHRLVYAIEYSPDGSLSGYVNFSMSYFNVSDFEEQSVPDDPEGKYNSVETCRYRDYREPPWDEDQYEFTSTYWHVVAAQFIFVVCFENVVILTTNLIAFAIPDMPRRLKEQVRREAYLTNEIILKTELELTHGGDGDLSEDELTRIRRRVTSGLMSKPMVPDVEPEEPESVV